MFRRIRDIVLVRLLLTGDGTECICHPIRNQGKPVLFVQCSRADRTPPARQSCSARAPIARRLCAAHRPLGRRSGASRSTSSSKTGPGDENNGVTRSICAVTKGRPSIGTPRSLPPRRAPGKDRHGEDAARGGHRGPRERELAGRRRHRHLWLHGEVWPRCGDGVALDVAAVLAEPRRPSL